MKKSGLLLLPLLVTALASCGGNGGEKVDENTVQFWHTFSQGMTTQLEKAAADFKAIMKEKGVDVTIKTTPQGGYDDLARKVTQGFAAGNVPTIAVSYQDSVADYIKQENGKYVYNLDNYFDDDEIGFGKQDYLGEIEDKDDIVESFLEEGSVFVKEGTYTLPFMKSTEALFYNMEYLIPAYRKVFNNPTASEADIKNWIDEVSWEDFIDFGEKLAPVMKEICDTFEYVLYYDSDSNFLITKMIQEGIGYSSIKDGKGHVDFEDATEKAKLIDYVEDLKDLADKKVLTTKGVQNKYGSDFFTKKKCLFTVGSTGGTGYNNPGTEFTPGVCKVPASKGNAKYVSQGPSLCFLKNPKYSDAQNDHLMDLAFQFYKYISSPEVNTILCLNGSEGYFPVTYSSYETANFKTVLRQNSLAANTYKMIINDIAGSYFSTPVFPGSASLREEMEGIVKLSLSGTKTVEQAVNDAIDTVKMKIN